MSADMVDDLHAAEDWISVQREALTDLAQMVAGAFAHGALAAKAHHAQAIAATGFLRRPRPRRPRRRGGPRLRLPRPRQREGSMKKRDTTNEATPILVSDLERRLSLLDGKEALFAYAQLVGKGPTSTGRDGSTVSQPMLEVRVQAEGSDDMAHVVLLRVRLDLGAGGPVR